MRPISPTPRRSTRRSPWRWPPRPRALVVAARGTAWRRAVAALIGVRAGAARVRDAGTATAEYAVATLAACGFAGLLVVIMRSAEVRGLLLGIVRRALAVG